MAGTFQGWRNRETWTVATWLRADRDLEQGARDASNQSGEMLQEAATSLHDFVEHLIGDGWMKTGPHGLERDLINCAMVRVHWEEIAQTFRGDS